MDLCWQKSIHGS
uniref:Early nodulin enod40-3 n=1 Tax=Trifolium repens TaxID=3899 RepID=Q8LLC3_TRIRP|nr:early nodulin enod40-3 [Trifolium repens]